MKHTRIFKILLALFAVVLCFGPVGLAEPVGTAFTYQGRLLDANQAADGLYDFQFKLFNDETVGNQLWGDVNTPEVDVIDGYFTVELDFGGVFDGNERWLEIGVRPGELEDPNVYTVLSPRQAITPTPYALYALNGGGGGSFWQMNGSDIYYNNGNVGIGTTSPVAKLDVIGDISATSVYKIGGGTVLSVVGTENTFVGVEAGAVNTGGGNTFSGYRTGFSNTTGTANTFSGVYAGYSNNTGGWNTFSGCQAGYSNTTGNCNTLSGTGAGYFNTTGGGNTFSGFWAGVFNTTGFSNTFSGNYAGWSNTEGSNNTFLGDSAGSFNGTGNGNVFLGYQAGYSETGSNKLYIANSSANPPLIYGDFSAGNVGLGTISPTAKLEVAGQVKITGGSPAAGKVLTSDSSGLATWQTLTETDPTVLASVKDGVSWGEVSGIPAGFADGIDDVGAGDNLGNHAATQNILLNGYWLSGDGGNEGVYVTNDGSVGIGTTSPAAKLDVSGDISTASNYKIGGITVLSVPGTGNTLVGSEAGLNNAGSYNTFSGYRAGYSNTWGHFNTFSGNRAGFSNTTGAGNIFLGSDAGYFNTTGNYNTFSGFGAGVKNTTGNANAFSGTEAGHSNTTGSNNTYSGSLAGWSNTTGSGNVFLGYRAGYYETGSNKLYIANSDANTLIYGDFSAGNVGIGTTTPGEKLAISLGAGFGSIASFSALNYNRFLISVNGSDTDLSAQSGNNLKLGTSFGGTSLTILNSTGNVGIGTTSPATKLDVNGVINTASTYQIRGNSVLSAGTDFTLNTFIGLDAGENTTGQYNTFSGYQAGYNTTTGGRNTFSGFQAGYRNTTGQDNTFSGNYAGYSNTTGFYNTFSGYAAGYSNTTGNGNVFLGYQAGYSETGSDKLYIDNSSTSTPLIYGNFSTNRVGINRVPTANPFEVEGNASKTTAGSWLANSDARIKTEVQTVTGALDTLDKVRLVSFKYNDNYRKEHSSIEDLRYLNVIAQEFRQVFPDYVKGSGEKLPNGDEIMQVDTYPLTVYSAAAIQELHRIVNEKDAEITQLQDRVSKMETQIAKLSLQQEGGIK